MISHGFLRGAFRRDALVPVAARCVVLVCLAGAIVACGSGSTAPTAQPTGVPVNPGGSGATGGDWRSYNVCALLPAAEAAALLGGLTPGAATVTDPASPSCRYTFSGGLSEMTISLRDAAAFTARYDAANDAVFGSDSNDIELKEFFGVFDEAFATTNLSGGVEFWFRKGELAAVFEVPGKVDDHRDLIIGLARALLLKV